MSNQHAESRFIWYRLYEPNTFLSSCIQLTRTRPLVCNRTESDDSLGSQLNDASDQRHSNYKVLN